MRQFDHGTGAKSSSKVRWARQNESKMIVMHEIVTGIFENLLNDGGCLCEAFENRNNSITLLHRYDAHVVLFVEPNKECLFFIVVNSTSIGPVTSTT